MILVRILAFPLADPMTFVKNLSLDGSHDFVEDPCVSLGGPYDFGEDPCVSLGGPYDVVEHPCVWRIL